MNGKQAYKAMVLGSDMLSRSEGCSRIDPEDVEWIELIIEFVEVIRHPDCCPRMAARKMPVVAFWRR